MLGVEVQRVHVDEVAAARLDTGRARELRREREAARRARREETHVETIRTCRQFVRADSPAVGDGRGRSEIGREDRRFDARVREPDGALDQVPRNTAGARGEPGDDVQDLHTATTALPARSASGYASRHRAGPTAAATARTTPSVAQSYVQSAILRRDSSPSRRRSVSDSTSRSSGATAVS